MLEPKLIIQELWRRNLAWDKQLPEDIKQRWIAWKRNISSLVKIKIPSWYGFTATDMVQLELHVFSDASQCVYGAVVYIRYILNKSLTRNFVLGKSRLAQIKKSSMSILKLDLQTALIAVRLKTTVMEEINLEIKKVFFWCDSKTVLNYNRNKHSNFGVYVAHRINEIPEYSSVSQWHYIPSNTNVADDATRCISFKQFGSNSRWFTVPSFLLNATLDDFSENIVSTDHIPETLTEVNVISNNVMISDINKSIFNLEYYSDLDKMIKHLAWILKLKSNWLNWDRNKKHRANLKYLTLSDIEESKLVLFRIAQIESYPEEYTLLSKGKCLPKNSLLIPLNPILQGNLICVGGRANPEKIEYPCKNQVIINKSHPILKLIIKDCHEKGAHIGREHTLALIRHKIWIPSCRGLIRKFLFDCLYCKCERIKPQKGFMSELPKERLDAYEKLFYNTGIDVFGPVIVKLSKKTRANQAKIKDMELYLPA